jgi:hypothetical protein
MSRRTKLIISKSDDENRSNGQNVLFLGGTEAFLGGVTE